MRFDNFKVKRLLTLLNFLDSAQHKMITSQEVESVALYSYRNINRIFKAFLKKSIGKYHKEKMLEIGAQQIVYSNISIPEIAFELGYSDLQAFNKAFKSVYEISPRKFREKYHEAFNNMLQQKLRDKAPVIEKMAYQQVNLSPFKALCLTHYGSYQSETIEENWKLLIDFAEQQQLINEQSKIFGEILDDFELAKDENCRYTAGVVVADKTTIESHGFIQLKSFSGGRYVVFQHKGDRYKMDEFYENIFLHWIIKNEFEIINQPIMEFYLNDNNNAEIEDLLTDVFIPIK